MCVPIVAACVVLPLAQAVVWEAKWTSLIINVVVVLLRLTQRQLNVVTAIRLSRGRGKNEGKTDQAIGRWGEL